MATHHCDVLNGCAAAVAVAILTAAGLHRNCVATQAIGRRHAMVDFHFCTFSRIRPFRNSLRFFFRPFTRQPTMSTNNETRQRKRGQGGSEQEEAPATTTETTTGEGAGSGNGAGSGVATSSVPPPLRKTKSRRTASGGSGAGAVTRVRIVSTDMPRQRQTFARTVVQELWRFQESTAAAARDIRAAFDSHVMNDVCTIVQCDKHTTQRAQANVLTVCLIHCCFVSCVQCGPTWSCIVGRHLTLCVRRVCSLLTCLLALPFAHMASV